jgi:tetratricopeptide (TPR) repeat protein
MSRFEKQRTVLKPPAEKAPPAASAPRISAEDDFSDIRIPSMPPEPKRSRQAPAAPRPLVGEIDLDSDFHFSTDSPGPTSVETSDEFDFDAFDEPMSSVPPTSRTSISATNSIELTSISPKAASLELDDDFDARSDISIPPALGLPSQSDEDEPSPGIPSLAPVKSSSESDAFGELDFMPTVEKSGPVRMDDDAEFDFENVGAAADNDDSAFDAGTFGDIELTSEPPDRADAPLKSEPKAPALKSQKVLPPLPPLKSAPVQPPLPKRKPEPQQIDSSISSLPPLGAMLDSTEAPFDGMPSPADLLNFGAPPPARSTQTTVDMPPRPSAAMPSRVEGTGMIDYGEVNLAPGETSGILDLDAEEFDGFPVQGPAEAASSTQNGDLDLAADPMSLRTEAVKISDDAPTTADETKKRGEFEGRRRFERQSRRTRVLLLVLLGIAIAAGSALGLTPYGPFGANILFQLIPKPVNQQAVDATKKSATKKVLRDTYASLKEAIRETEAAHKEFPSSDDLQFHLAYLYYLLEARFGIDKAMDAKASKLLNVPSLKESISEDAPLAQVSEYLRYSRPLPRDAALVSALRKTPNGTALFATAQLAANRVDEALTTARALDSKENSPRSGYLLSRVLVRKGDKASIAEAAFRLSQVIQQETDHVDAMLLFGEALLMQKGSDKEKIRSIVGQVLAAAEKPNGPLAVQKAEAHAVLAGLFVKERSYLEADKEIAAAEKLDPENVRMLLSKGSVALVRKDFSTAAGAFSKAQGNAPENIFAKLGKIETDIEGGELSASKEALISLLPKNKDNARAHYLMGEINAALKENEGAEKELKTAIELDDALLEAYVSLSMIYLAESRNDDAMKILDKASVTVPGSPLIKKTLAAGHAARGDWAAAIIELDNALKIDPDDVEAHFQMAVMYRKMESLTDAKAALTEVEKRNPNYPGLALEQGFLMEQTGDVASALYAYKKALSLSPNDAGLKLRVGVASFLAGDFAGAEKNLAEVVEKQPASPEGNFYYGETFRVQKRTAEAVGFLKKACELSRDNSLYHLRLGMALDEIRETEQAKKELETAIQLDSKNAEAYIEIGRIKLRRGAVRDAVANLEKGLTLDPSISRGYLAAAEAYEQLSDISSALKYYRKASTVEPNNPEVFYRLGLAELQINGKAVSLDAFDRAVSQSEKLDPKPEWYYEALFRRGSAERARGLRAQAIASFKLYLKEAPENQIDRSEVIANLNDLGEE